MADEPDGKDGVPTKDAEIPETRKNDALPKAAVNEDGVVPDDATAPPDRLSAVDMLADVIYVDDGNFAKRVRKLDDLIGKGEQLVLVAILALICSVGATHAILDKAFHVHVPYKTEVIHYGTFAIALLGGAFASHQAKHLSMDLLSRRFSPRNRLILKIVLSLFVIFVITLLIRSGLHNIEVEKNFAQPATVLITTVKVAWLIPIAGTLMIVHTLLHILLDADYLRRGKTPPEKMRSAH